MRGVSAPSSGGPIAGMDEARSVFGLNIDPYAPRMNMQTGNVAEGGKAGDIHLDHNMPLLNAPKLLTALNNMGMDNGEIQDWMSRFKSDPGNYNPGQSEGQKNVGAMIGLNTVAILHTLNRDARGLSEDGSLVNAAEALNAARSGNGAEVRRVLGGDGNPNLAGLTDADLAAIWNMNPHANDEQGVHVVHAILNAMPGQHAPAFSSAHIASMNKSHTKAGFNDTRDYPEWGLMINGRPGHGGPKGQIETLMAESGISQYLG